MEGSDPQFSDNLQPVEVKLTITIDGIIVSLGPDGKLVFTDSDTGEIIDTTIKEPPKEA